MFFHGFNKQNDMNQPFSTLQPPFPDVFLVSQRVSPGVSSVEEDAVLEGSDAHGEGSKAPAAMGLHVLRRLVWANEELVGGSATPLKNKKVNWDDYSQYMGK